MVNFTFLAMLYVYQFSCKYNFVGTKTYLRILGLKNNVDPKSILVVTRSNGVKWGQRKQKLSIFLMFFKNQLRSTIYSLKNILTCLERLVSGP